MAVTTCPDCGREVSTRAATCAGCGRPTEATLRRRFGAAEWAVIVVGTILIVAWLMGVYEIPGLKWLR